MALIEIDGSAINSMVIFHGKLLVISHNQMVHGPDGHSTNGQFGQVNGCWKRHKSSSTKMGMDQYQLIPFLGEWPSIYQLFWCSPGVQGFDTLPNDQTEAHFFSFRGVRWMHSHSFVERFHREFLEASGCDQVLWFPGFRSWFAK